jgi:hypothetical protein
MGVIMSLRVMSVMSVSLRMVMAVRETATVTMRTGFMVMPMFVALLRVAVAVL